MGVGSFWVSLALLAAGLVAGLLYVRHARRVADPILDMRLMQVPSFALSAIGGGFSRIAAGSMPFLLPMMLQLGFGFSAAHSGLITFIAAAGALVMKAAAMPVLRRFGFRTCLIANGLLAACLLLGVRGFPARLAGAGDLCGAAGVWVSACR